MKENEPSEDSLVIAVPRRRGRPRAEQQSLRVSAWIPTHEYDRLVKTANRRDQSVSALVRDLLTISRSVKRSGA